MSFQIAHTLEYSLYYFAYPVTSQPVEWCCHAQQPLIPLTYNCHFPQSKVSSNLLNKLGDLNTYIKDEVLTYVIILPVVSRENLGVFKLIAILIILENKDFLYIEWAEIILCLDQTRLYCLMTEETELYHCKATTTGSYVLTQIQAVMCSDWQETGVVKLLKHRGNIVRCD